MCAQIYFDNAATTPTDPRVIETMHPFFYSSFGNPASLHNAGRIAKQAVENARMQVASLLKAEPEEIIFTSSGTESDNMALKGTAGYFGFRQTHIIVSAIEHPAILETCNYLEKSGVAITRIPVNDDGIINPSLVEDAITPNTKLISVMSANNVTGIIQPVTEIGNIARTQGILFHTDAVQAIGKIPFDMKKLPIDLLSLSAHKFNGPKGIGALFIRKEVQLTPLIHGGGQERGMRSSTLNIPGIVGLGKAAEIANREMADETTRIVRLRDLIIDKVTSIIPNLYLIGHRYCRLPGHICLGFAGFEGDAIKLLLELDGYDIAVSSGSACSSDHASEPSYVLLSMGFDPIRARGSLRLSLGRFNTKEEVENFLEIMPSIINRLSPTISSASKKLIDDDL